MGNSGKGTVNVASTGDVLSCKVIQGGTSPILEMNGIQIKTHATTKLLNAKEGDTVYLQIQKATKEQICLKIMNPFVNEAEAELGATTNTEVLKNTEQVSELIKKNLGGIKDEREAKEDQKEILSKLTKDEIAKLRMMQIDITNAKLSDLMGMVITIRSDEHQEEMIETIEDAVESAKEAVKNISSISDAQITYLVKNELHMTIDNLYKSKFSSVEQGVANPLSTEAWSQIYPQVENIINQAGMPLSEQALEGARFMLERELPLTVDSLRTYMAAKGIQARGYHTKQVEENIAEQAIMGNSPMHANVYGSTIKNRAQTLINKIENIQFSALAEATIQGKPLTPSYLYNRSMEVISRKKMETTAQNSENMDDHFSSNSLFLTAKRQLEEIRLSMTLDAAIKLVNKDMHIDARELSQIVEALKEEENRLYDKLLNIQPEEDMQLPTDLLKEAMQKTQGLANMPAFALAEMVRTPDITVNSFYLHSVSVKLSIAGNAYETMMTTPRSDMGDSMKKAFQNVDDIIKDLHMPITEANQRAIRILAYNRMELSTENILEVKLADAKMNEMFEMINPQIVLNMIKANKNPLHMTIDELNGEINHQHETLGVQGEEKYSAFLYKTEQKKEITAAERKSFIGIYRLLDKVEKAKGKDIGTLVKNGQEITLENLLTATKSAKAAGIDISGDDSFGERENTEQSGERIAEQIEAAYQEKVVKEILRHINPETLLQMKELGNYDNMPLELFAHHLKKTYVTDDAIEQKYEQSILDDVQQSLTAEEEVLDMLNEHNMELTVNNILAAHGVMRKKGGIFDMIKDGTSDFSKEAKERIQEKEADILEAFTDSNTIRESYETLAKTVSDAMHENEEDGIITSKQIAALKYINAGMHIVSGMTNNETYQIPIAIGEEISIMKVSVIRNNSQSGHIEATISTEYSGDVKASLYAGDGSIEGYIVCENERSQQKLMDNELTIKASFAKIGMETKDVRLDGTMPLEYGSNIEKGSVATKKLYQVAKQLVIAIKLTGVLSDN